MFGADLIAKQSDSEKLARRELSRRPGRIKQHHAKKHQKKIAYFVTTQNIHIRTRTYHRGTTREVLSLLQIRKAFWKRNVNALFIAFVVEDSLRSVSGIHLTTAETNLWRVTALQLHLHLSTRTFRRLNFTTTQQLQMDGTAEAIWSNFAPFFCRRQSWQSKGDCPG